MSKSKIGSVVRRHAGNIVAPKCDVKLMCVRFFASEILNLNGGWVDCPHWHPEDKGNTFMTPL